jgi:hypothetical protein
MNKAIELSALASENLRMLSPELVARFHALFRTSDFRKINGKRLRGMHPDTFTVQLDEEVHVLYRLLNRGEKLQILNVYQPHSVFDRA